MKLVAKGAVNRDNIGLDDDVTLNRHQDNVWTNSNQVKIKIHYIHIESGAVI